jgi:hypothetical protein
MKHAVLLDSTVFILYLVGCTDRSFIRTHKALRDSAYSEEDFDLLIDYLRGAEQLLVTPHVLAETSNLAKRILPPARDAVYLFLREIVARLNEVGEPSSVAMQRTEFVRLGLTDAALLNVAARPEVTLLTADLDLYLAALSSGYRAVNFAHLQDNYLYS